MPPQIFQDNPLHCSFSLQLIFFQNIFDIRFSYKHCNFSHVCLLVKMASKTVTRSIHIIITLTVYTTPKLQALVVQKMDSAIHQAPVVQKLDSAIQRINLYPVDSAIGFPNTYPLDRDLSAGQCYPAFEQPGPDKSLSSG